MILDILEQKISDAGLGLIGQTIFRSSMPADCTVGVMTRIPLEGIPVDPYMPGRHKGRIQIIVRHTDPVLGGDLARKVSDALEVWSPHNYPASSERGPAIISLFIPETLPIEFPRLEGDGIEWSIHFNAVFSVEGL